jgi:hypothetical protein
LWEPINNLKGTSWEHIRKHGKLKKNLPYPPLTWALLLAERKINPLLPSPPAAPNKTYMENQVSILDNPFSTPHTLETKNLPSNLQPPNPKPKT